MAVRAELGLESLETRRRRARLRWYRSLRGMEPSRLPAAVYTYSLEAPLRTRGVKIWAHGVRRDWEALHRSATAGQQHDDLPEDSIDACYENASEHFRHH